jgi:pSer/pThr/pTyr-binding forkhead associated (FHA) protein
MFELEMPTLIMQEGQGAGRSWPVEKERVIIGRSEDCDVVLVERQVSRHHAQIRRADSQYILEDMGSKNGTYVNGREVIGPYILQDGDEIQIALCIKLSFVAPGATAPLVFERGKRPGLYLDKERHEVLVGERELSPPLSLAQYRLLEFLYDGAERVCSRDEIVEAVWPEASEEGVTDQAIDALVRRLRERIAEVDPDHEYIVTVRGHGFHLDKTPSG